MEDVVLFAKIKFYCYSESNDARMTELIQWIEKNWGKEGFAAKWEELKSCYLEATRIA